MKFFHSQHSRFRQISCLLTGLLLFANGTYMLMLKKVHLGTLLPLFIGILLIGYAVFYSIIQKQLNGNKKLRSTVKSLWILFYLWIFSVLCFFSYIALNIENASEIPPLKAIIILGSGTENGKPTPTLAKRLDSAAAVALKQPRTILIPSGGQDFGEKYTEAEVMQNYLIQQYQVSPTRIFQENKSTSTELNLKNSQSILQQQQISMHSPIGIVTSDFHTLRARAIAHKQGYSNTVMIAAPTPLYNRYNAWLREYFAYISGWILNEY
ncbi:YdcF family protein [Acinetobacter chinensis]|uniref:YdcF family protein n=1 Tax=Acinetobacter chinensis TaxID=2004650 RepID=A0A3B7LYL9_9GAMM|nr:YdcF family protein [Acinetobacter chinensis]AXY57498.1 YdcF family protein [Acinetobacter chinensis]